MSTMFCIFMQFILLLLVVHKSVANRCASPCCKLHEAIFFCRKHDKFRVLCPSEYLVPKNVVYSAWEDDTGEKARGDDDFLGKMDIVQVDQNSWKCASDVKYLNSDGEFDGNRAQEYYVELSADCVSADETRRPQTRCSCRMTHCILEEELIMVEEQVDTCLHGRVTHIRNYYKPQRIVKYDDAQCTCNN